MRGSRVLSTRASGGASSPQGKEARSTTGCLEPEEVVKRQPEKTSPLFDET